MDDELHFTRVTPAVQIIESPTKETVKDLQKGKPTNFINRLSKKL